MKQLFILLVMLLGITTAEDTISVDIHHFPPCVNLEGGTPVGFDIELFELLADDLGWAYRYNQVDHFTSLLDNVKGERCDLSLAGITITGDREQFADFSHPYLASGLSIMVRKAKAASLFTVVGNYLSTTWKALLIFLLFLLICSVIIWKLENGHDSFNDSFLAGVSDGMYWTNTTMTTVGYGDKCPQTPAGKFFAVLVMWVGIVVIFPYIVASMSVSMNDVYGSSTIESVEDLRGRKVATKQGITAQVYLQELGAAVVAKNSIEECYELLRSGRVDAIVYDMPSLTHYVNGYGRNEFQLTGGVFDKQGYGIAMPNGSALREPLNRALLDFMRTDRYWDLHRKWFGDE